MGSNYSTLIDAANEASFDDHRMREYLMDLINENPECFEDFEDDIIEKTVRPYGPIREMRNRSTNLWLSPWGLLITSDQIRIPGSYQDRLFRKRFRLPFALFLEFVEECKEHNIFEEKKAGKIAVEFKIMIALRVLGRDECNDSVAEYLNIGESTIGPIFKQFLAGCVKYLYPKYVYIPENEELNQIRLVYEKMGLPGCIGSMDCTHILWHRCPKILRNNCTGKSKSFFKIIHYLTL